MMNFVLAGADPRSHGIPMDEGSYANLFRSMSKFKATIGIRLCWKEISTSASSALAAGKFFVLKDRSVDGAFLLRIANGEIDRALARNYRRFARQLDWAKFVLRARCPKIYDFARRTYRFFH
jgi:hypothetical protein